MARAWFFLVLLNSSSFSATRLSISCLTWQAQVAHAALCFLPSLRWPLLLLMQLEAPPFLFPICGAAYQDHEWSVLLLQVAQQLHPELLSSGTTLSYNSFLHLGRQQLQLGHPFTKDLVKILCTLLSNQSSTMDTFIFH